MRIAALAVLGLALSAPAPAHAQPAGDKADKADKPGASAPSDADMQKAKKAFAEGKRLFDAKQYAEAVDKFKESYRLSKNPLLLYNVGVTLDQKGDRDLALFYYKKFLSDAPPDAAQRDEVTARVKELEKAAATDATSAGSGSGSGAGSSAGNGSGSGSGSGSQAMSTGSGSGSETGSGSGTGSGSDAEVEPPPDHHPKHPKGAAYTATDFEHQVIDSAPPGKPLDLTAYAPEDAGWQVTMFYRGSGDATFTSVPMRPRYHELVARIPGKRMNGASVQYYIEVRDREGAVVTRVGHASSPNLVYLDASAKPVFYPDLDDSDGTAAAALQTDDHHDNLGEHHDDETPSGGGYFDVGSHKFEQVKWGSTYTAGGLFVLTGVFYLVASNASSTIEGDAARSQSDCGTPPCSTYDADLKALDSRGRGFNTMTNVALVFTLAAGGIAGYYWYEDHTHKGAAEHAARARGHDFVATPVVGDGFFGGAAALHF